MSNKFQCISYLILISIFIDQGDGRWKDREKEELQRDFMAYRKFKEKLQKHIEEFYDHHPREFTFPNKNEPNLKDFELDIFKQSLVNPKNEFEKLKINVTKNTQDEPSRHGFEPNNEKMDELQLKKLSKSQIQSEHSTSYPGWPKFEDLLRTVGKQYDWKNDRWIKVKKKDQLVSVTEDENPIHYYAKHEFRYKVLKANKANKKRKNVVVVTAVR